jgi:hypothetical protein
VPKAGTTSLFHYLAQHPDICASSAKGTRYFKPLAQQGGALPDRESYSRFFAHCRGETYRMEGTPGYSFGGERMLAAIKAMLGRPRIVISLRDPVERLWSAYTFQRTKANLPGIDSFEQYISACERQRGRGENIVVGGHFNGVSISMYADYLESWFTAFGEDVRIIFAEQLFSDPGGVVAELCRFLAIDDDVASSFDYGVRNKTAHARNLAVSRKAQSLKRKSDGVLKRAPALKEGLRKAYQRVNTTRDLGQSLQPATRGRLEDLYRDSNSAVSELLSSKGYDRLPEWLDAHRASDPAHQTHRLDGRLDARKST